MIRQDGHPARKVIRAVPWNFALNLLVEKEESTIVTHAHTAQPVSSPSKRAPAAVVCEPSTSDKLDIFEAVIKWFY